MSLYCLVHGSTQSPAGWDLLVAELQRRGHATVCPDLPVDQPDASATVYADVIVEALQDAAERPIVVAHSASGLFLPLVAARRPVARMVFLAAAIPQVGKSFLEQYRAAPEMYCADFVGKDPTRSEDLARHFLFHDCSDDDARWAISTLRLMNARQALIETCPLTAWPGVPASYIVCSQDRTLRPEWWRKVARERLGSDAIEMDAGHSPHVSRPAELAEILLRL